MKLPGGVMKNNSAKFVMLIILAVLFLSLGKFCPIDRGACQVFLGRLPAGLSEAAFVFLYVTVSFFVWIGPKDIFKFVGVFVYGLYLSALLVYLAEMINAALLFSLSRKLGRSFVEARLPGKMRRVDQAIGNTGFLSIFFLRFFPVIPFRFLDLAFGLTGISLRKYLIIAALSSPLRIFMVQLFLSLGLDTVMNPERFAAYLLEHPQIFQLSFLYSFGSIIAGIVIGRKMRGAPLSRRRPAQAHSGPAQSAGVVNK